MQRRIYYCPVEVSMEIIGAKWTAVVLAHIKEEPRRFSELRRLIPHMSEKVLAQRLRDLERNGILVRTVVSVTPPHVTYDLTPEGQTLAPVLQSLYDWGQDWAEANDIAIDESVDPASR